MEIKLIDINTLKEYKENPRSITTEGMERLKRQIRKKKQYKPLLVNSGKYWGEEGTVIGGNMRLRAFQELGINKVWILFLHPKSKDEFLEYSLSDNDRAGFYDEDLLTKLLPEFNLDWSDYAIDTMEPMLIADISVLIPEDFNQKNKEIDPDNLAGDLNTQCPRCGFKFNNEQA